MQTLTEIRAMLAEAHLRPRKAFGQCFLIDHNMLAKLLELGELAPGAPPGRTVLEVGPGTGTLTEELLDLRLGVVAAEIDHGMCTLLSRRLGSREGFTLIAGDVLAGKHEIAPGVLAALPERTQLVSNLPYSIATCLLAECLAESWRHRMRPDGRRRCFERMTFTVQREVADRLAAPPGTDAYGAVSVMTAVLGTVTPGPIVAPGSFWPRPNVDSRMCRIDFDGARAADLADVAVLQRLLQLSFGQRRKQIKSLVRRKGLPWPAGAVQDALAAAGVDGSQRPERIAPTAYVAIANALARVVE
jgi:16S rRNA (adenine1518-N6/adenine1519-N6)-dimethyltransferase